jgi:hypothetical protein
MDLTRLTIGDHIDRLKRGWKWCGTCGLAAVHPLAAPGTAECPDCRAHNASGAKLRPAYCLDCGKHLDANRRQHFRRCWYCYRGYTKPHLFYGVKLPDEWLPENRAMPDHLVFFSYGSGTRMTVPGSVPAHP